jgi:hypothetical protein
VKAGGSYRKRDKEIQVKAKGPKRLTSLPGSLARAFDALGGGDLHGHYELVPKIAYLSIVSSNGVMGSDYQSVVAKLEEKTAGFVVRPLPIVDGAPGPNTGIEFTKDPEFSDAFIVEPAVDGVLSEAARAELITAKGKVFKKWLSAPVREALLEMPELHLRVEGQTMTLTLYGAVDADEIDHLVTTADVIFAEYGADGGPSLLGDDDEVETAGEPVEPPAKKPVKSKPQGRFV